MEESSPSCHLTGIGVCLKSGIVSAFAADRPDAVLLAPHPSVNCAVTEPSEMGPKDNPEGHVFRLCPVI